MDRRRGGSTIPGGRSGSVDALGVAALVFLAADQDRLHDFLAASGIGPMDLRAAAEDPSFLRGVLAHLANDDALLVAFAASRGEPPERLGATIAVILHGDEWSGQ